MKESSRSKRVMVDMSATIIHHGHIRLIQKASEYGSVVIGLTTDEQILSFKGYQAELPFVDRKEILEALKGVDEVVPTPWLITEDVLDEYDIDFLVHGHDNSNPIPKNRLLVLPRTEGISSTEIRQRALKSITFINNRKLMLTPGPAAVLYENLASIKPVFGRGDDEYKKIHTKVIDWIKEKSGQDKVVTAQGSATFALELAAHSFVTGNVLLISTGYYSDRLTQLLPKNCDVRICKYDEISSIKGNFDWVLCAYTETSHAFKVDLSVIRKKADELGAFLYVDSTGSIGLEGHHELCDVTAFSSCKGLFGLTGACFIAYKNKLTPKSTSKFYFNLETHHEKKVTGPYHILLSLYGSMAIHDTLRQRVIKSKQAVMDRFANYIPSQNNQPLLCTYFNGKVVPQDKNIVMYTPRSDLPGSIICHFGEIYQADVELTNRISIEHLT